jgi:hypothetical protein
MKDYGLRRSALGFSKETKIGYFCKILTMDVRMLAHRTWSN